ncbi:hypothetical protein D3C85_1733210 [compost metagenome]
MGDSVGEVRKAKYNPFFGFKNGEGCIFRGFIPFVQKHFVKFENIAFGFFVKNFDTVLIRFAFSGFRFGNP